MPLPVDVQLADARRRLGKAKGYIPHKPTPRQAEFLACEELEALYGGAAGGGKTDALLMDALQDVHVPGYAAIILRRTYPDLALPGAVMDRSHDWLRGTDATWNDRDKRWTFPSGATLSFGYLDSEKDKYRYQSAEFQFIAFDELTQFPEAWYRYLLSRLRKREGMPVRLRMRAASNPGGIGHRWVYRRFVEATRVGAFIPAKLEDNPHLDQASYRANLARLDAMTRAQLLEGAWVADGSGLVYSYDPSRNRVEAAPKMDRKVLAMDFGVKDATSFTILGWRKHERTVYVLRSWKLRDLIPDEAGKMARELEEAEHFDRIVGDVGGLGKAFAEEMRRRFNVPVEAAEKKNKRGYIALMNGAMERGAIKIVGPACRELEKEWLELPWNEDRTEEAPGFENHCADGALYGWRACMAYDETDAPEAESEEAKMERLDEERFQRENSDEWWDHLG